MNEIIKKNLLLLVVMAVALVISGVLLFFVIQTYAEMSESIDKVESYKEKINNLNLAKPAPLPDNLNLIQKDTAVAQTKASEIQAIFGNTMRKPLRAFIKAINGDESTFNAEWVQFAKEKLSGANKPDAVEVLAQFIKSKNVSDENYLAAKNSFAEELAKLEFTAIPSRKIEDYLLEALGVNQKLSKSESKIFFTNVEKVIVDRMTRADITLPGGKTFVLFNEFTSRMPNPNEAPYIIKHCRLSEDLFRRIADAGVAQVNSIKRVNLLEGEPISNYLILSYELNFTSSMQAARKFLNSLQTAYFDDKIYRISNIELRKGKDEIKDLAPFVDPFQPPEEDKLKKSPLEPPDLIPPGVRMGRPSAKSPVKASPFVRIQPVVGTSSLIDVKLEFDYIIYIGNEISRD